MNASKVLGFINFLIMPLVLCIIMNTMSWNALDAGGKAGISLFFWVLGIGWFSCLIAFFAVLPGDLRKKKFRKRKISHIEEIKHREQRKAIAIVGNGFVGCWFPFHFTDRIRSVVPEFIGIDGDHVHPENYAIKRWTCYEEKYNDIPKVYAYQDIFRSRIQSVKFTPIYEFITSKTSNEELDRIFSRARVIVLAIDTGEGIERIATYFKPKLPVILGGVYLNGGGFAARTLPHKGPCMAHLLGLKSYDELRNHSTRSTKATPRDRDHVVLQMVNLAWGAYNMPSSIIEPNLVIIKRTQGFQFTVESFGREKSRFCPGCEEAL
jgi:hypothetical protein